jgi:hypothetical protein
MDHDHKDRRTTRGTLARAAALAVAGGVLITVSIVSDPDESSAVAREGAARWLDESGRWPMVGELVSMDYIVRVYAAAQGTVYTICEPDGTVIRSGLSGDEVAEAFPELDLSPAGDQGYVLMRVETDG